MMRSRNTIAAAALAGIVLLAVVVGGAVAVSLLRDKPAPVPLAAEPAQQTEPATAADSGSGPDEFNEKWHATYEAEYEEDGGLDASSIDGAKFRVELSVGAPVEHPEGKLAEPFSDILDACPSGFDAGVVVPVRIKYVNLSEQSLSVRFGPGRSGPVELDSYVGTSSGAGAKCDYRDSSSVYYDGEDEIAPANSGENPFLLVFPNYFDSDHPDGRPNALREHVVGVSVGLIDDSGREMVTNFKLTCSSSNLDPSEFSEPLVDGDGLIPRLPVSDPPKDSEFGNGTGVESPTLEALPGCD